MSYGLVKAMTGECEVQFMILLLKTLKLTKEPKA